MYFIEAVCTEVSWAVL